MWILKNRFAQLGLCIIVFGTALNAWPDSKPYSGEVHISDKGKEKGNQTIELSLNSPDGSRISFVLLVSAVFGLIGAVFGENLGYRGCNHVFSHRGFDSNCLHYSRSADSNGQSDDHSSGDGIVCRQTGGWNI